MTEFSLIPTRQGEQLQIEGVLPDGFHGTQQGESWLCPMDAANAAALRKQFPWTAPTLTGLRKSVGCGDRLGLATPGHLMAVQGSGMFPVLPQQSIREMQRAQRTAQQVIDDVVWNVFRMNYQGGYGSDADHLKNTQVIDECIAAGFVGFTLDPGEFVDNAAHTDDPATLQAKFAALPWDELGTTPEATLQRYTGNTPAGPASDVDVRRAACKYGRSLAHVLVLVRQIDSHLGQNPYDLEISVDETDTPTSPFEHYFIAAELTRLNVEFQGLAPRFVGSFEKGVDYIGDLRVFEEDFIGHVKVQQEFNYKLSIHSGSDKFSIYPIIARHAGERVHLKTAGTSWLEALRIIARYKHDLFRDMLASAKHAYPKDRASYHVSGEITKIPPVDNDHLADLLDNFDARQILHVTFGTLLAQYRDPLYAALETHREDYWQTIKAHFEKHIAPFVTQDKPA